MKKILVFFTFNTSLNDWKNCGILERELSYYYRLSKNNDIKFEFLTYGSDSDLEIIIDKSITINPIFKNQNKSISKISIFFKSLFYIFKNRNYFFQFDIYKTNQNYGSWMAVLSKLLYKKKLISRCGYDLFHFATLEKRIFKSLISYFICTIIYNFADVVFVPSGYYKLFVNKFFFINKSKIHVIPNFVDTLKFNYINTNRFTNRVIFLGRLEHQKNLKNIIDIFTNNNFYLDVYGNGSQKKILSDYANKNKSNITFNNRINNEEIPDLLSKYNYLILFSTYEGNPKILLEAMSCSLCVIGSNVIGIKDIISHNQNGLIFNLNSADKIIKTISKITNDDLLRLKNNARRTIVDNFSLNITSNKELKILHNLINN